VGRRRDGRKVSKDEAVKNKPVFRDLRVSPSQFSADVERQGERADVWEDRRKRE